MTGVEAALASGLLNVAGKKLVSLISSEFAAITGVKKDLSDLQDIHAEITSWLSAVSYRAIERDPSLRWVMKLRNLANDIYDLIDEVDLEDEKHKIHNDPERHAIADLFAKPKLLLFRRKVAHKIKAIKVTFDAIVKQRNNVNTILQSFQVDQPVQSRNDKAAREQSLLSNPQESKIPSRDHVKSKIISKLLESNNGEHGHIISIVGLGGSGKTTLAQHICHDNKIKGYFKGSVFWVHVSQEFCGEKLICKLFEAIIEEKSVLHAQQHMLRAISNKLCSKKFLLVLDDAWHEDRLDWENFTVHINNGASGSKILLTTRNENVAKAAECKLVFMLPLLAMDESWTFFLKSSCWIQEDLESDFITGKDIVRKCGGVPLAVKTLGYVLQEKRRIKTWRAIRESNLWDEENIKGLVFAPLILSYIHLKDHLKQCFTFCSIFPKGYEINKDHLIEEWIAHGFIKCMKEEQPEDIGSDYFNSLEQYNFESVGEFSNLQTINLSWCNNFQSLPSKSLCHMLHTLDLSSTKIIMLPQWVTTIHTLECIDLKQCWKLVELPKGIGNLKRLKVLNIEGCDKLRSLLSGLGQLTCLRKLGLFVVGCGGDDARISDLKILHQLSGHLEIKNLMYLKELRHTGESYLKHMSNIQSVVLDWSLSETEELLCDMEQEQGILSALEPPSQIKDMKIIGYQGSSLPRWMMANNDSSFCEAMMLKQTGPCQFLSLTELRLENCTNLKQMRGLGQLPSLKSLFLDFLANLEELWTVTRDFENPQEEIRRQCCFPSLSYISISGCPRLNVKPYVPPSLQKLHLCNNNMQLLSPVSFSQMLPPRVNEPSTSYTMHSAVSHLKELNLREMMMGSSSGWELLQHHTQLEILRIDYFIEMTELPDSIRSLTSLRELSIDGCHTLGVLPDWLRELCSLRSLEVRWNIMMQSLPQSTKHLRSSLVRPEIGGWD